MGDAWGEFVKRGLIKDWDQDQAMVVFQAFSAGVAAERARMRAELLHLTDVLRKDVRKIYEGQ